VEVELILVDDASDRDLSEEYARAACCPGERYVRLECQRGIAAARNKGVSMARNDWIVLLDSDDLLLPNFFREIRPYLGRSAQFVFTDHVKRTKDLSTILETRHKSTYYQQLREHAGSLLDPFLTHTFLIHCHILRRQLFSQVGSFNESIDFGDEIDFHLRASSLLQPYQFAHVPEVLYVYRENPAGVCEDPYKYRRLISNIEGLLLAEMQRRGGDSTECKRIGKEHDGAVRYEYT